jgi:hypothetical protein
VSRAATQSAKKDGEAQLNRSAENLRLVMINQRLKEQNKTLEDLWILRNDQVQGLTKKVDDHETLFRKCKKLLMRTIKFWKTIAPPWRRMPRRLTP